MGRLSVNINAETAASLREIADKRDINVTEVIRRAVSVLKFMEDEKSRGKDIQLVDRATDERTTLAVL